MDNEIPDVSTVTDPCVTMAGEENKDAVIQIYIIPGKPHEGFENVLLSGIGIYEVSDSVEGKAKLINQYLSYLARVAHGIRERRRVL